MEIRISGLDENRQVTVTRDADKVILTVDSVRIQLSATEAFAVTNALGLLAESVVGPRSR